MKTFLKKMIEFYNIEVKNESIQDENFKKFKSENTDRLESFNLKIKEFETGIDKLTFEANNSKISNTSKKYNTIEIKSPFFKKSEDNNTSIDEGTATIIFTLNNFSKNFKEIKEDNLHIYGIYFEKGIIGCLYIEKNKLNYFIETNSVEISVIKSVNIDFDNYKNIIY